jgi:hypothetical protein
MSIFLQPVTSAEAHELPPEGSHLARLVALIDLGTHQAQYQDARPKVERRLYLAWELIGLNRTDGRPHILARVFNMSLHPKSALRQLLQQWGGTALRDGESVDFTRLLGQPCLLSITHQAVNDRKFARVAGALQVPRGLTVAEATRTPVLWEVDGNDPLPEHAWLPYCFGRPVKDWIIDSPEWGRRAGRATTPGAKASGATKPDDSTPPW